LTSNSEKAKEKYFCAEGWTKVMGLKVLAKIIFRREWMGLWNRDLNDSAPGKSRTPGRLLICPSGRMHRHAL
jgi:hypothetical protein